MFGNVSDAQVSPRKKHEEKKQDGQIVLQLKRWMEGFKGEWLEIVWCIFLAKSYLQVKLFILNLSEGAENVPQVYPSIALAAVSGVKLLLVTTPLPPSMLF